MRASLRKNWIPAYAGMSGRTLLVPEPVEPHDLGTAGWLVGIIRVGAGNEYRRLRFGPGGLGRADGGRRFGLGHNRLAPRFCGFRLFGERRERGLLGRRLLRLGHR